MSKSKVILRSVAEQGVRAAVRQCMEACDWENLVPKDAVVFLKPNLCTGIPEKVEMSDTSPEMAASVCEILLERTRRVYIGESDGLREPIQKCFDAAGYADLARKLPVRLVNLSKVPWTKVQCDPAGEIDLPQVLLEADVLITLPVLKTHSLTYFTGALKNQWGCLPHYNRILLHKYLDEMLVSLHRLLRPKLAIMDGIVGVEGRGPANGKPRRMDLVLASTDSVALDSTAMRLVRLQPDRSRHVVLAAKQGLGRMHPEEIQVDGDWERHATQFEPAVYDIAQRSMNYMTRYPWFVKYMLEKDVVFFPVRNFVQFLRRVGLVEGGG